MANLILPRRFTQQPQYPVELAPDYLKDSALAFNFSSPLARNFAAKGYGKILTPVNPVQAAGPMGLGVKTSSDKSFLDLDYGNPILTSNGVGTGDYMIAGVIHPQPSANRGAVIHIRRADAPPYATIFVVANGYYVENSLGGTSESGTLFFGDFNSFENNARGVKAAGVITGQPIAFAAHRKAGTFELWINGRLAASNTTSVNSVVSGTQGLAIGGWTVSTTLPYLDPVHSIYAANRALYDGEGAELTRNYWQIFKPRSRVLYFDAATGGATITVNQASETDSAQAFTSRKLKSFGQASETDSAQIITPELVSGQILVALNQASEIDTANAFGKRKNYHQNAVIPVETDTAQSLTKIKLKAFTQASETDSAQAFTKRKIKAFAQAIETDSAQPITSLGTKTVIVTQVVETDSAQAFTVRKIKAFAQASETDSVGAFAKRKIKTAAQVFETDEAQAITFIGTKYIAVGQATETDSAQAIIRYGITAPARTGGGDGIWRAPYITPKTTKKPIKKKVEVKPPKPVRESLIEALTKSLTEAPVEKPITVQPPVRTWPEPTVSPVAAPVLDKNDAILQLLRELVASQSASQVELESLRGQVELLTATIEQLQVQLQYNAEDVEALTLINASLGVM